MPKEEELMACFNRASPALVEILSRLISVERPTDVDHCLYEFGSVKYHVQALALEPHNIYLSVSTPPLSPEFLLSNGLPNYILHDIKNMYSDVVELIIPPKEGFLLTMKVDVTKFPNSKDDRMKAITEISSIQAAILCLQLKDMLWNLDSQDKTIAICKPIKLVYHPKEPFFVVRMTEKITAIFPMRFKDNSDVVIATSFFQELMDVGYSSACAKAPRCTWSPIPPQELRGESFHHLTTNGGFVSFDIFPQHVKGAKVDKTMWILLNFYAYVKHYVKCTRAFIQRKMRQRLESLAEVLQKARIGEGEDHKTLGIASRKGYSCVKKVFRLSKSKIFRKKIQTMRWRIKVKRLYRFRQRWFKIPKFSSFRKYTKLD
ncbi:Actin-related protein 2/3 complex subunit 2 protein [Dioscorea alata]|uniref:Actin-related protein 2/3 complex subunit 2 protein n=1 Tax=Dioscorea alata TaxID=55571 RepID=A0ACB7UPW1_DIOAL|nr:Actin-related protein 2/3 complex subunit 2 protein [Dioscorea alata]